MVSHDLLKKIKPKTDDDKVNNYQLNIKHIIFFLQRELVYFINEVERELRRQKRLKEVGVMFELGEELGLFPSKYQRPNMFMSDLRASPVWRAADSGQEEQFEETGEMEQEETQQNEEPDQQQNKEDQSGTEEEEIRSSVEMEVL